MLFSFITKNLKWEMLTKNLVTFKKWHGGSLKNPIFKGDSRKTNIQRGGLSKKGEGLGQFADLRRGLVKKWGCFEGVDTPMHTGARKLGKSYGRRMLLQQ